MSRKEHDFCECQRVYDRETMVRKIDVMLSQNQGLVQYQKSEDHPKIKCDNETT